MNGGSRHERDGVPMEWLEERLRALSGVQPPAGLREKLVARLAYLPIHESTEFGSRFWRAVGWASAAAAVVCLACVITWFGRPSGTSTPGAGGSDGQSASVVTADHNGLRPPDVNISDTNGLW